MDSLDLSMVKWIVGKVSVSKLLIFLFVCSMYFKRPQSKLKDMRLILFVCSPTHAKYPIALFAVTSVPSLSVDSHG